MDGKTIIQHVIVLLFLFELHLLLHVKSGSLLG